MAASGGQLGIISFLLQNGAALEAKDRVGQFAYFVVRSSYVVVTLFIAMGVLFLLFTIVF